MKLTIDDEVLARYNITLPEFLLMLHTLYEGDINETTKSLVDKNFAFPNAISSPNIILNNMQEDMVNSILIDSDAAVKDKDDYYYELAEKLQDLYPKGKKPGTAYPWRGSRAEIAKKLKTLVVKYKYRFTEAQAIKATKEYVNKHVEMGDFTQMRLLKYFILKTVSDADGNAEIKSDFMALIDNAGQEDEPPVDWLNKLA